MGAIAVDLTVPIRNAFEHGYSLRCALLLLGGMQYELRRARCRWAWITADYEAMARQLKEWEVRSSFARVLCIYPRFRLPVVLSQCMRDAEEAGFLIVRHGRDDQFSPALSPHEMAVLIKAEGQCFVSARIFAQHYLYHRGVLSRLLPLR